MTLIYLFLQSSNIFLESVKVEKVGKIRHHIVDDTKEK